ncbi:putative NUC173-domain-containing protein [Lyophyllum shimeji]|uniref:NUC173-domain-containing protein n=1 Tax=Lyophyllum shimeji TaxID=47721 RepID=A0A9P3UNV0_LYOSH|nr:putative NUC173-domain-containing protein [Lyophyllum shimeji]
MEETLAKIRPHTSSSLPHQKTPAVLLIALESTFTAQKTDPSPTAYFAALLTTLDGTLQKQRQGSDETEVLHAELYLLALIAPFVSTPVIRTNLDTVLSLTLPLFPSLKDHAPALRSQLSLYHVVYQSLDRSQLETPGIRQTFATILQLCIDPRPKVRKKAADVVKDFLSSPPAPLSRHPYSERVAEWVKAVLSETSAEPLSKSKAKASEASPEIALHVVAFLRPILAKLPPSSIPHIADLLLALPRLGNPYLSQSAYSALSDLFSLHSEDDTHVGDQLSDVLNVVLASPPSKSDTILSPAWVQLLGNAFSVYRPADTDTHANELGKVWKTVWSFLESNDASTRKAAAQSLETLSRCFTPALISSALLDKDSISTLRKIITQTTKALDSLAFVRAMPELLSVVSAVIANLRHRPGGKLSPTAAESLLLPLIEHVGKLRTQKGFEYKEAADATLGTAMRVLGPEVLLRVLPLNLEPSDRQAGREPRAYLLPLLPQPHPSPLSHFISYFVPLSERMFDLQTTAEAENRPSEAKVWSVLVAQIWTGFVGYCHGTPDLKESLTPSFAQLLSQLLYGQPELRPAVLKALKTMVESNVNLATPKEGEVPNPDAITPSQAADNLDVLRAQAESWLAVLFNVFGSVGRDSLGMVGDVISVWASIAGEGEITKAYVKVIDLFRSNMTQAVKAPHQHRGPNDSASVTATTQDILILLLPYLSVIDATALFNLCLTAEVLGGKDHGVQKRGYKILTKLVESRKVAIDAEAILRQLDELSEGLAAAAKKDRFNLLALLVPLIPSSAMHIIPSLIPEAVLGTKEPSEKARTAAFELILAMGRKMNEGGVVKRDLIDGMDEDGAKDAVANLEEFLTMVAGGLAASPHMISATVTAISRLVFEFKDIISEKMHTEIFTTLLVFLSSANREIVKSILGFVKLAIHTLPTHIIHPHLKTLVPALLTWSHDHKNHFKAKVRHIFERMLRRFEWDEIYSCAGEGEAAKVLVNIRKRKERAKRKKNNRAEAGEDEEEAPSTKPTTGDAFEDVLYGSESELDDSDDDASAPVSKNSKKKTLRHGVRLRMDDDEPMDLLSGAASRITNATSNGRRKPGQDASRFKTDEETGKMIIDDENTIDDEDTAAAEDVAGTAYRESITSVDGFTRGPNGRIKFNKDTKKRRREAADLEDVEMADGESRPAASKQNKKKVEQKIGQEFKAKRAGGDVKKKGMDPYAYVSLSRAAKKGGRAGRSGLGIAGKR